MLLKYGLTAHRADGVHLNGVYRGHVNGVIQSACNDIGRYEELADIKYAVAGDIFDIMAVTVIQHYLAYVA
jgi:hypothetical protein